MSERQKFMNILLTLGRFRQTEAAIILPHLKIRTTTKKTMKYLSFSKCVEGLFLNLPRRGFKSLLKKVSNKTVQ